MAYFLKLYSYKNTKKLTSVCFELKWKEKRFKGTLPLHQEIKQTTN